YKKMMHADFDNLYFIGLFQPQGCIWPLADFQSKIAAKIIAGSLDRPTDLHNKIQKEMQQLSRRYKTDVRHALEVDYQKFRKELLQELKRTSKKSLDACCK